LKIKNENKKKKKDAKPDLPIIDAVSCFFSHPSTFECISPNSAMLFPRFLGASSERITLYVRT
jgi:hypothetical protein